MTLSASGASVFGQRLRHYRRLRGLTLDELGSMVGRPAPYLSLVENGRREPKASQISAFAEALGITTADLLDPTPPNRRAALELDLERAQADPRYVELGLPYLKSSAKLPDAAIDHIVTLFGRLTAAWRDDFVSAVERATAELGKDLCTRDGYLAGVEAIAASALHLCDYPGTGPVTSRHVSDIVAGFGYRLRSIDDIPASVRAVIDEKRKRIYIAQRNELRTRQARKAVLQTIGSIALGHSEARTPTELLRQRLESAYFAAAVLVPEHPALTLLHAARSDRDLSVEDLKEHFSVSYEMAAQRLTNLATVHLGIRTHFIRADEEGRIWKAYENDGVPLPADDEGTHEGRILCRAFGARTAYSSPERFDVHHQYTETRAGTFWCATHVSADQSGHAFTFGVGFDDARLFRGRTTNQHRVSLCPEGVCCAPGSENVRAFPRLQERLVGLLTPGLGPAVDPAELSSLVERHGHEEAPAFLEEIR